MNLNLDDLKLDSGSHSSPEHGMCVMEAVAFVAGEPHTDSPQCACPVISSFMRAWNDALNDVDRQMLKPYITRLIGTKASPEIEVLRARLAQDWYIRTFTPTWLELAGLSDHAEALRKLDQITSDADFEAAQSSLSAAESAARSATESAEWNAAMSAAESAAWSALESSAWSALESVTWSEVESAARRAARSAAESAAWVAARSAVESEVESAAWIARESAALGAVWSAVGEALSPTVKQLQKSAFDLLNRMIEVR